LRAAISSEASEKARKRREGKEEKGREEKGDWVRDGRESRGDGGGDTKGKKETR
jgi:hypothetical protein